MTAGSLARRVLGRESGSVTAAGGSLSQRRRARRPRRLPRLAAVALSAALAVIGFGAAPASAAAQQTTLTYLGYLAGVPVFNLRATVTVPVSGSGATAAPENGVYQINAQMGTTGNLALLYPYQAEMQANGRMSVGRPSPKQFTSNQSIWQKQETVTLNYDGAGDVSITANPLTQLGKQVVQSGNANNTMDPASAVLALVGAFSARNACGGSYAVFDGVRRYDITVEQAGKANVSMLQQSFYQGPAMECHAAPRLVGGFQQAAVQNQLYPQSARLWLARPMTNFPAVPVRISAQNALGEMVLDLVNMQ